MLKKTCIKSKSAARVPADPFNGYKKSRRENVDL